MRKDPAAERLELVTPHLPSARSRGARLRIALVGHHVAPIAPPFSGGVEALTYSLGRWLGEQGHEVVLFALPGSRVPGVEVRELDMVPAPTRAARADVSMPPADFLAAHHAYQHLMLELGRGEEAFDVVHLHSLHYLPVAMAPLLGTPSVLTLHCPPTPWLESALRARVGTVPALAAVSRATARAWRGSAEVADVISNGVDLDLFAPGPGGDAVAWSGRLVAEKAPHLAIDVARRAGRGIRLAGPMIDRDYFAAEVAPRLGDDAEYVGHLDHPELAALVGESAAMLLTPVWDEPFGLVAAEAMACGTPVAAFARGGLSRVIGPRSGRLAPADDIQGLARALREAIELPRAGVRAHAVEHHGVDAMGRAHEALYARLLGREASVGEPRRRRSGVVAPGAGAPTPVARELELA